jgi:hypothetical protein
MTDRDARTDYGLAPWAAQGLVFALDVSLKPLGKGLRVVRCTRRDFMWSLALLIICAQVAVAQAQIYSMPMTAPEEKLEDVQARTSALTKQAFPEREQLLLRDLDHTDAETANALGRRAAANSYQGAKSYTDQLVDHLGKVSKVIASFDCDKNLNKYGDASQSYSTAFTEFLPLASTYALGLDTDQIRLPPGRIDQSNTCKDTQAKFSSPEYTASLTQLVDAVQKGAGKLSADENALASAYDKYLEALSQRRAKLQEQLNTSQSAFQIGNNLWALLLILAIACVATILGISLFSEQLQFEWVASGQVIQFVTVMILLIVVLALGLSGILKENVLGTLLGGIAGYVLAQGVGRSAARDVTRAAFAAPAPPPAAPPPAAPPPAAPPHA